MGIGAETTSLAQLLARARARLLAWASDVMSRGSWLHGSDMHAKPNHNTGPRSLPRVAYGTHAHHFTWTV